MLKFVPAVFRTLLLAFIGFALAACQAPESGSPSTSVSPIYAAGPAETTYCTSAITISGATATITGNATYQTRQLILGTGLGGPGAPLPIRYAEVRVTDSAGNVAQCGETDGSGNYSVILPKNSATYTISINSRGTNSKVNATVMDQPEKNQHYSLTTSVVADSDKTASPLVATVTGEIIGAAFNIFDQIVKTNEYLRTEVGTCSFTGCQNFTVAPKVQAYWRKGFNPATYFGSASSGVSFYLPSYSRLFILGGISGDVNTSDTDHFDNSIIIHEYGHFIEDILTKSDSPGGRHNGEGVIDPRLAWGEGWGNFIQAAVRGQANYADTTGNTDGTANFAIFVDVESKDAACGTGGAPPICDVPANAGEGNFREFEITRFLWDIIDTGNDGETITGGFPQVWAALTSSAGFKNSLASFRSIGLMHDIQAGLAGATDWDPLRTDANHRHGLKVDTTIGYLGDWATYMSVTGASCSIGDATQRSITASGSASSNHLLLNNDFYHYKHAGGTLTTTLKYKTNSGVEADLDLYIYNSSDRIYGSSSVDTADAKANQLGKSTAEPDGNIATSQSETVVIGGLAAGDYLIKVNAYVASAPWWAYKL